MYLYFILLLPISNTLDTHADLMVLNQTKMPSLEELKQAMATHLHFKSSLKTPHERMRMSHLAPTFKIKSGYNNLDSDALKTGAYSENYRSGFNIDVTLEWQFSLAIWDTQEVQFYQQELTALKTQQTQWLDLSRYYFQYINLLHQYAQTQTPLEQQRLHTQMLDIAIQINAMTGGCFKEKSILNN